MLTAKLVQIIEKEWEVIAHAAIRKMRDDPALPTIRELPEPTLLGWGEGLLLSLRTWTEAQDLNALAARSFESGRARFAEQIPLAEIVRAFHLWRESAVSLLRGLGFERSSLDVYIEEELEHDLIGFYDFALYHLVRGYEEARQQQQDLERPVAAEHTLREKLWHRRKHSVD